MNTIKTILNQFNKFKLSNSYFTTKYSLTNEMVQRFKSMSNKEDSFIHHEIVSRFTDFILNTYSKSIIKEKDNITNETRYTIELFVFKKEDFKTILETVIEEMPLTDILKIKDIK